MKSVLLTIEHLYIIWDAFSDEIDRICDLEKEDIPLVLLTEQDLETYKNERRTELRERQNEIKSLLDSLMREGYRYNERCILIKELGP